MRVLEHCSSNFDDDRHIAAELLKVFYGRRDHTLEEMSDDEVLKLAAIHAQLAQAHATRDLDTVLENLHHSNSI